MGNGFRNNVISSDFHSNTIGNGFVGNTVGSNFRFVTVREGVRNVRFTALPIRPPTSTNFTNVHGANHGQTMSRIGEGHVAVTWHQGVALL